MEAILVKCLVRFVDRRRVSALFEAKFPPGTRPFLQPERLLVSFGLTLWRSKEIESASRSTAEQPTHLGVLKRTLPLDSPPGRHVLSRANVLLTSSTPRRPVSGTGTAQSGRE